MCVYVRSPRLKACPSCSPKLQTPRSHGLTATSTAAAAVTGARRQVVLGDVRLRVPVPRDEKGRTWRTRQSLVWGKWFQGRPHWYRSGESRLHSMPHG